MSNPGVIQLSECIINDKCFRIEDNIGEAIHIHYGEIRLDLTVKEFVSLTNQLIFIMNEMINVPGFLVENHDAIFLTECCERLLFLEKITYDDVLVGDLMTDMITDETAELVSMSGSRVFKALNGDETLLNKRVQTNYYGFSNISRLNKINQSIKKNGYPYKNQMIVVSEDGSYVIDGCHRASCLLDLYGNITIPIERWVSKEKIYNDYYEQLVLRREELKLIAKKEAVNYKKKYVKDLLSKELATKRIALKGAGRHTRELLNLVAGNLNIVGIVAQEVMKEYNIPCFQSMDELIEKCKPEVVIISSFAYRDEMWFDLLPYEDQFEIYDIYLKGLDTEFFT